MPRKKPMKVQRSRRTSAAVGDAVELERFLVACQKSLARAFEASHETSRSEHSFVVGNRPLFAVDELQFNVSAGLVADEYGKPRLDFEAPAEGRSNLMFKVARRPLEITGQQRIELANLDPLLVKYPVMPLRITCTDDELQPAALQHVVLVIAQAGDPSPDNRFELQADLLGRVELRLDLKRRRLKALGSKEIAREHHVSLRDEGECYVWAEVMDQGKLAHRTTTLILPMR